MYLEVTIKPESVGQSVFEMSWATPVTRSVSGSWLHNRTPSADLHTEISIACTKGSAAAWA